MSYFHLNLILKGKLTVCCLLMLSVIPLNAQREAKQIGDFKESISFSPRRVCQIIGTFSSRITGFTMPGAIGWRMPLSGWRAGYTGDALGWHDRARTHFDVYAASQVTDVPNTIPHPAQDSTMNLARSNKGPAFLSSNEKPTPKRLPPLVDRVYGHYSLREPPHVPSILLSAREVHQ